MDMRVRLHAEAEKQRAAIREAIAFKKYEFDAHGVEMNQRYNPRTWSTDGQMEPAFELDAELHYQPTTWPGARIPHVWLFDHDTGEQFSTLDLSARGVHDLTGIGGEAWEAAAAEVGPEFGIDIQVHVIGPRRRIVDHHRRLGAGPRDHRQAAACWCGPTSMSLAREDVRDPGR
jgi:2,4-dichlorophenol 6-monooxygenase